MSGLTIPAVTPDDSNLDAALKYAKAGWYVGPEKRGTKNPGSVLGDGWVNRPGFSGGWFVSSEGLQMAWL
jgi:hypothetical protein